MNSNWQAFLEQEGAIIDAQGIRFPERPAPGGVAAVPLVHLGVLRSRGPDSTTFLHGLVSNDVKKLAPDGAQWNSFNTPKGRMLASLLLWPADEGHLMAVAADIQAAFTKKLSMYILRSKVKLSDANDELALIGVTGDGAGALLAAMGLPVPDGDMRLATAAGSFVVRLDPQDFILAVPVAEAPARFAALRTQGAVPADTTVWQLAMIRAGLPLVTAATQEEFVAQMLNYEVIGGVSFNKGCYPGQEIVARTQYLGKLKKRMYRVRIDTEEPPHAGADIFTPAFGEQSAGKLVNVAPAPEGGFEALAVMQMSCAESGDARLGGPDGPPLAFLELPYALP